LLVFLLALIPHCVGSFVSLVVLETGAWGGAHGFVTLLVTGVGNLLGIVLILWRSRWAPSFFMLYLPLLVALNLLYPDLLGTANARLAAMGASDGIAPVTLWSLVGLNVALVVVMMVYWARSRRVLAVFGTRGLDALRGQAS
jgi:hypothetical protein